MSEATFCPLLLLANEDLTVAQITEYLLVTAREHIDVCIEREITICISRGTLDTIMSLFPWSLEGDDRFRQQVTFWRQAVLVPLRKHCILISVPPQKAITQSNMKCQVSNLRNLCSTWNAWLSHWGRGDLTIGTRSTRGLATSPTCSNVMRSRTPCDWYTSVGDVSDWVLVCIPWYHKYPRELPFGGQFPFVPPANWENRGSPSRGNQNGYLDRDGQEWKWGTHHGKHWDVQIPRVGSHIRVTPDGRII